MSIDEQLQNLDRTKIDFSREKNNLLNTALRKITINLIKQGMDNEFIKRTCELEDQEINELREKFKKLDMARQEKVALNLIKHGLNNEFIITTTELQEEEINALKEALKKGKIEIIVEQLNKKFGIVSNEYVEKLKLLSNKELNKIGVKILDLENLRELDRYLMDCAD
ncbi:DUF4351 domain-containing protein [Clostridium ganghwense]|uniref:DUF4351 domain-containing protein n=1 Tax=Clostridium ganghwense TaxID=312089 RepID=A0ABT4CS50_9CLOT|nr:DUF4351 domain-containing protein [Clostridium ganghwense]MCY6371748.1 DUF4351 domain-containing protein [Clostridium ganghwense]